MGGDRAITAAVPAGIALGVCSRIEEITAGFSLGISSNGAWLALAFVLGICAASPAGAAAAGALALTLANLGYYAWIAATEPGRDLAIVAGPPAEWFLLGAGGGMVFGWAGRAWRAAAGPFRRLVAGLLLAGVLVVENLDGVLEGHLTHAPGVLAGVALPVASAPRGAPRALAVAATAALVAAAATGRLTPLMP